MLGVNTLYETNKIFVAVSYEVTEMSKRLVYKYCFLCYEFGYRDSAEWMLHTTQRVECQIKRTRHGTIFRTNKDEFGFRVIGQVRRGLWHLQSPPYYNEICIFAHSNGRRLVAESDAMYMTQQHSNVSVNAAKQAGDDNNAESPTKMHNIPLDSSLRTEPIHPLISEVKLSSNVNIPSTDTAMHNSTSNFKAPITTLNPITSQPFTDDELRAHKLESLLSQYPTPDMAMRARDDTAAELRKILDENERKNREIDRELDEKEKTREIERKVYARKLGKDT